MMYTIGLLIKYLLETVHCNRFLKYPGVRLYLTTGIFFYRIAIENLSITTKFVIYKNTGMDINILSNQKMFEEVITESQIVVVETLAKEIWTEHYTPIIGKDQVKYMLEKLQSREAIAEQITSGYQYFIIRKNTKSIGYLAVISRVNDLFLSKIYIKSIERGKGFARKAIQFVEDLAKEKGLNKITLTVNKNNINSIKAYEKIGFKNLGSIVKDIGGGFLMDDYEMAKDL